MNKDQQERRGTWTLRRRSLLLAAPAVLSTPAWAWPLRPVRVIVPYAPSGGTDTFTRYVMNALSAELGQTFLVENRAGANGVIGSEAVFRAPPDGYTFMVVVSTHLLNRYVMPTLPFDPVRDFTPVMRLCRTLGGLVSSRQAPFDSVATLLAYARANPGHVSVGHSEAATAYAGHLLARLAGIELISVPYRGGGPMMTDLVAGNLMTAFTSTGSAMAHVRAGRIRLLGVNAATRSALLPDVPTIQEQGVPGYETTGWYGLFGPPQLPPDITERLSATLFRVIASEQVRPRLEELGFDLSMLGPEAFLRELEQEDRGWARAAAEGLLKPAQE